MAPTPSYVGPCTTSPCRLGTRLQDVYHPAEGLQRPHGGCPAVVCFWDFPPPGVMVARAVHFVPPLTEEPRWEMFPPGHLPEGFTRTAAVSIPTVAQPACDLPVPNRLDL